MLHNEPIIIVGMQRSGTSALSGALRELGVFFGREDLLYQADTNNPGGYFEHRKATTLNLWCLDTFQMHPTSFGQLPKDWQEHPTALALTKELKKFLVDDFARQGRWGIKQPVTSLVLPLYNHVFAQLGVRPHYVVCVRNPLENMASEARLDFGDAYRVMASLGPRAIGSWLRYTLGSLADAQSHTVNVVPYNELLADPSMVLNKIVGLHSDWNPTSDQWKRAICSVQTGQRHHVATAEDLEKYPSIVKRTFLATQKFDENAPECWQLLGELHREFCAWTEMMSDSEPITGGLSLGWFEDGQPRTASVKEIPTGSWQSVSLAVPAWPKTPVTGILYGAPCRVWIRKCVWKVAERETVATILPGLASNYEFDSGIYRLDAAREPNPINLVTPKGDGPYELRLEFLFEVGPSISENMALRLSRRLDQCVGAVDRLTR